MRHAQPTRLRTRPGPAGRLTHSPARRGEAEQRRRLRRRCSGGARAGYGAAPRASRVLRIALRGDTRLRRALDPRASATPQAANGAGPACPDPNAGTTRPATRSTSLQPKSPRFEGIDASTPCLHFHNQMNASSGTRLRDNHPGWGLKWWVISCAGIHRVGAEGVATSGRGSCRSAAGCPDSAVGGSLIWRLLVRPSPP